MTSIVFLDRDSLPTAVPPLPLPHRWQDYPATSPEQLLSHARGAQVLISNKVPLRAEHFAQLPELKLVAVAATGVNQIDLDAARAHGVAVCNVRNYGADAVAEHALMLMLALSRNLFAYRRAVLEGGWQQSAQFCLHAAPMKDLSARTLAVCGGGAIGEALAAKAAARARRRRSSPAWRAAVLRALPMPMAALRLAMSSRPRSTAGGSRDGAPSSRKTPSRAPPASTTGADQMRLIRAPRLAACNGAQWGVAWMSSSKRAP